MELVIYVVKDVNETKSRINRPVYE